MTECKPNEMDVIFTKTTIEECKELYQIGCIFKAKNIFSSTYYLNSGQLNENTNLTVLNVSEVRNCKNEIVDDEAIIRFLIN